MFLSMEQRKPQNRIDYSIKYGEIFRDTIAGQIWFICAQCEIDEFNGFDEFMAHIHIHITAIKIEPALEEDAYKEETDIFTDSFDSHNPAELPSPVPPPLASPSSISPSPPSPTTKSKKTKHKSSSTKPIKMNKLVRRNSSSSPPPPSKLSRPSRLKPLYCTHCSTNLEGFGKHLLLDHLWTVHSLGFPCPHCNRQFRAKSNMKIHHARHFDQRPFKCDICEKTFRHKLGLSTHIQIHSDTKPYLCSDCGKTFKTYNCVASHQKLVHAQHFDADGNQVFLHCHLCNHSFKNRKLLVTHLQRYHSDRRFQCDICSVTLKNRASILQHMLIHVGKKKYECRYCGMAFMQPAGQKQHERLQHEGIKQF